MGEPHPQKEEAHYQENKVQESETLHEIWCHNPTNKRGVAKVGQRTWHQLYAM